MNETERYNARLALINNLQSRSVSDEVKSLIIQNIRDISNQDEISAIETILDKFEQYPTPDESQQEEIVTELEGLKDQFASIARRGGQQLLANLIPKLWSGAQKLEEAWNEMVNEITPDNDDESIVDSPYSTESPTSQVTKLDHMFGKDSSMMRGCKKLFEKVSFEIDGSNLKVKINASEEHKNYKNQLVSFLEFYNDEEFEKILARQELKKNDIVAVFKFLNESKKDNFVNAVGLSNNATDEDILEKIESINSLLHQSLNEILKRCSIDYEIEITKLTSDFRNYELNKENIENWDKLINKFTKCYALLNKTPSLDLEMIKKIVKRYKLLRESGIGEQWAPDKQFRDEANNQIQAAFEKCLKIEDLWDKDKGFLNGEHQTVDSRGRVKSVIGELLFTAYSSNYDRGQPDEKRRSENRTAEIIKSELLGKFDIQITQILRNIEAKIAQEKEILINKSSGKNVDLSSIDELEKSKAKLIDFLKNVMKDYIIDVKEIHDINNQALREALKVNDTTKEKVSGYMTWLTTVSITAKKRLAESIENFTLDEKETETSKDANLHQKLQTLFYQHLSELIAKNGGKIPKDLFITLVSEEGTQSIKAIVEFRDKVIHSLYPDKKNDIVVKNKITSLVWTMLSIELITKRLPAFLASYPAPLANEQPYDVRPMRGLLSAMNPQYFFGGNGLMGAQAFGTPFVMHSTEIPVIPFESDSDLIARNPLAYTENDGRISRFLAKLFPRRKSTYPKPINPSEELLLIPGEKMDHKVGMIVQVALRHPSLALSLLWQGLTGRELSGMIGKGGVGMQTPEQNKKHSTLFINYDFFKIGKTRAEVKDERGEDGKPKENSTQYGLYGGMSFEDALTEGRTDHVLFWTEKMRSWGSEHFTHSKLSETIKKKAENKFKEMNGFKKDPKDPNKYIPDKDNEDTKDLNVFIEIYGLGFDEYLEALASDGSAADVFEMTKGEAREQTILALIKYMADKAVREYDENKVAITSNTNLNEKLKKIKSEYDLYCQAQAIADNHWNKKFEANPTIKAMIKRRAERQGLRDEKEYLTLMMLKRLKSADSISLSKTILSYEADGTKEGESFLTPIKNNFTFTELAILNQDRMQAEVLSRLDPAEIIDTVLARLPVLAKGHVEYYSKTGDVGNDKKKIKSAFEFFFDTPQSDIIDDVSQRLHRKGRYEIIVAFRAFFKNSTGIEANDRHNLDHVKRFMDLFTKTVDLEEVTDPKSNKITTKIPEENKNVLKYIHQAVFIARHGGELEYWEAAENKFIKVRVEGFLKSYTKGWRLDTQVRYSKTDETTKKVENHVEDLNVFLEKFKGQSQKSEVEKATLALFSGDNAFFNHFYTGNGKFESNRPNAQGTIDGNGEGDNVWYRFAQIWGRGNGSNLQVPAGYTDTLTRISKSVAESDAKNKSQSEILYDAVLKAHNLKSELSAASKANDDKKFFEKLVSGQDEINKLLTSYKSFAQKDEFQVDIFRLAVRLIGENPQLRGVVGFMRNLTINENVSIATNKKRVYANTAWAPNVQGFENYAYSLYNDKIITYRGYWLCLQAVKAEYYNRAWGHWIPLYATAGILGMAAYTIYEGVTKGAEDAGFEMNAKGGKK